MSDVTVNVTNAGAAGVTVTNGSTVNATVGNGGSVSVATGTISPGNATVVSGTVNVGKVTTLSSGSSATVTNSGTTYNAVIDFGIPAGPASTVSVGSTTTLSAGSNATVTATTSGGNVSLAFGIPAGKAGSDGSTPSISIGTVSTGAAGSSATVTANKVSGGVSLDFTIPAGVTGATGTGGIGANDTVDGGDYVGTGSTGGGGGGSSSTDSLWSSVRLLVNADGAAYGYDSSSNKCYVSSVGNAAATTTNPKFGTKSLAFDGAGDYLYVNGGTASLAFGTGDFTAETWLYMNSLPASGKAYDIFDSREVLDINNPTIGFQMGVQDAGNLFANWGTTSPGGSMYGGSLSAGVWHHVALVRSSGSMRLYVNGIMAASSTTNVGLNLDGPTLFISRVFTSSTYLETNNLMGYLNGYLDDVRLTAAARYTGTSTSGVNFTVPTAAFPTS